MWPTTTTFPRRTSYLVYILSNTGNATYFPYPLTACSEPNCKTCSSEGSVCDTCKSGYHKSSDGKCIGKNFYEYISDFDQIRWNRYLRYWSEHVWHVPIALFGKLIYYTLFKFSLCYSFVGFWKRCLLNLIPFFVLIAFTCLIVSEKKKVNKQYGLSWRHTCIYSVHGHQLW